ncbi:HAD-IC family P-type ATPase [Companilactobacillus halodurans]|uniref:HAD-IC family P-type ATPase n=1 Tax=Companilactobacillus halodurans TaxID=2584183 RepID=A0A5P0ZYM6_9LACO|nr:HAD-IC family P-type ATPase [Companilactobacillus halodurans]MQS75935.1 HAD-IC family P-type ATPase [Companilactobacillus halodurans]MQS98149.1 HAD-IC family P-type ATPase [Companilactobacillus halodurans]
MKEKYGLTTQDVTKIRQESGFNETPKIKKTFLSLIGKRLIGPIPYIIELALIIELLLGNYIQVGFIFALLLFSAIDGAIQENRAAQSIGELDSKLIAYTSVFRDGKWQKISSRELVPDDLIHLSVGSIVPADCKIVAGTILVNQAVVTGETSAITKIEGDGLYSGSTVIEGSADVLVQKIGKESSLGKTTELVRTNEAPGRLENLLFTVVKYLAYLDIVLAVILTIAALVRQTPFLTLLPFLVILFVATIPISMPSSFAVANSLEAGILSKKGILVSGLTGIQEAGSMDVLLMDKTGTITKNEPRLDNLISLNGVAESYLLQYALATVKTSSVNPLDQAILKAAKDKNISKLIVKEQVSFDPKLKGAKAVLKNGDEVFLGSPVKGDLDDKALRQIEKQASLGLQVLVLAVNQEVIGLLTFKDQVKDDMPQTIAALKEQGVRILMVTGDTASTASAIAKNVGLSKPIGTVNDALNNPLEFDGFANVYPKDKFKIVKSLQNQGHVVGMTGDGINDAPALKQADVGIAIDSATDISKMAARIILTAPSLMGITELVESGHRVYQRMMTWLITKLARTAQLALLLTCGYLFTNFFPVSLNIIVFIVIFNDCVTLTLGTDRVRTKRLPENWNLKNLTKISAIYTIGWLLLGFLILWYTLNYTVLNHGQISGLLFAYLIYSAMGMILSTRTRNHFWSIKTSKAVGTVILINFILSTLISIFFLKVGAIDILVVFLISCLMFLILDWLKVLYYQK